MDVIILAGGLGTRLRSVVNEVPKCMAPVCGKPFLYYILTYLTKYEIDKVILSVGYLSENIIEWIRTDGYQFPFNFDFVTEEEPLGTGGGIKLAFNKIFSDEVCILNGDTFFDLNLNQFLKTHIKNKATISIALKPMKNFERYGNVIQNSDNVITTFTEKTHCDHGYINGGVYLMNNNYSLFNNLPKKFSFEQDVLQKQVSNGNIYGFIDNGYFVDIGIPEDYNKANIDFNTLF